MFQYKPKMDRFPLEGEGSPSFRAFSNVEESVERESVLSGHVVAMDSRGAGGDGGREDAFGRSMGGRGAQRH